MSDGYDYTRAPHVLGISTDDGLIELHVWWKYECRITAVGRGLFLCPSVKKSESNLATASWLFLVVGVGARASFPSTGDGKCVHKLFYSRMFARIPHNAGSCPVFHYPAGFQHLVGIEVVKKWKCSIRARQCLSYLYVLILHRLIFICNGSIRVT